MNALDQLAELLRYAEQTKAETRQLRAELTALQERVAKLEAAAPAPAHKRRAPEPASPAAPRAEPVIHVRREAAAPPSLAKGADPAWTATLLARYGEAVLDLSGAGEAFMAEYAPVAATRTPGADDYAAGGDPYEAMLWAVGARGGAFALLPGYKAINNWSGHFAPNRTTTAAQYFGHAFELDAGAARLTVAAPALLTEASPGRLTLSQRGRLSGFRT